MKETKQKKGSTNERALDSNLQAGKYKLREVEEQTQQAMNRAANAVEENSDKAANKAGESFEKVAPIAQELHKKTGGKVNNTYQHAKKYRVEHPGKILFIALGVGVGIGFILGQNTHPSSGTRYAKPIITAASDVAMQFFR
ncbi:MAG: hypothetical protein RBT36_08170 [Desulfobulbus sp.]|jgi:ElaB/YqjD/DUF883 family membrane-anchored ribosome-binding protein|nr:hypothetical protein [Desulfobulbus sp.]